MAISRLLARLGFVRIGRFGLVLTPDDRILSTRPAVLDDGLGGKIVGWDEGDLAAMELEHWQPMGARPAMPAKIIALPAMAALPPPIPRSAKVTASVPITSPAAVQVAPAEPTEDDEWEWEIAVAKARATADPIPADSWPKTQELREEVRRWEPQPVPRHLILPHQRVSHVPAKPPARMPSATERQRLPLRAAPSASPAMTVLSKPELEPTKVRAVVTLRAPLATPAPKKFDMARTEPSVTIAAPPVRPTVQAPIPNPPRPASKHEETIRTLAAPPAAANDDRTDTAIALPPAPSVASSSRRVAARER
ncbi:MAG TPA: hypothetical protein VH143_03580 [Kofleriaceae bacterium]|jgi:hypothetical protein|nr:hypothetical protein [Kofleriaceae bacterium]